MCMATAPDTTHMAITCANRCRGCQEGRVSSSGGARSGAERDRTVVRVSVARRGTEQGEKNRGKPRSSKGRVDRSAVRTAPPWTASRIPTDHIGSGALTPIRAIRIGSDQRGGRRGGYGVRRLGSEPPVSHGLCLWVGLSTVLGVNRVEENQGGEEGEHLVQRTETSMGER